jgi:hypothetical protein
MTPEVELRGYASNDSLWRHASAPSNRGLALEAAWLASFSGSGLG